MHVIETYTVLFFLYIYHQMPKIVIATRNSSEKKNIFRHALPSLLSTKTQESLPSYQLVQGNGTEGVCLCMHQGRGASVMAPWQWLKHMKLSKHFTMQVMDAWKNTAFKNTQVSYSYSKKKKIIHRYNTWCKYTHTQGSYGKMTVLFYGVSALNN